MRKTILWALWLLTPALLLAYHYGPGQARLAIDHAKTSIAQARACEAKEDWAGAVEAWGDALAATPKDKVQERLELRLARAHARMYVGELPEANQELENLLAEAQNTGADPALQREIRGALAGGQYYAGWLMRLEGAGTEEWLQQVDSARQHFRLLAEESPARVETVAHEKNLEATIRLARMDLSELKGLPLPKKCSGCKNVSQKCRSQCQSKCEKKDEPKEKKDARGAGFNEMPKGGS